MISIRLLLYILLSYCTTIKTMDEALAPFVFIDDPYPDPLPRLWEDNFLSDAQCSLNIINQESDIIMPIEDNEADSMEDITQQVVIHPAPTKQQLQPASFYKKLAILREHFGQRDQKGTLHYVCQYPDCTTTTPSMDILKRHEQRKHEKSKPYPYQCNYPSCGRRFPHLLGLYQHAQRYFSAFRCPYPCDTSFGQYASLKKHIKAYHSTPQQFTCDHCQVFSAQCHANLATHINRCLKNPNNATCHSNTSSKPQFFSPESIPALAHMILGKKRKLIPETINLDNDQDQSSDNAQSDQENIKAIFTALENRFRIYKDGMYQYPCPYPQCEVVKLNTTQIDTHAQREHRYDPHLPYYCNYANCSNKYKYFSALRTHIIQHLELYHCTSCDISYSCHARLKDHNRRLHRSKKHKS